MSMNSNLMNQIATKLHDVSQIQKQIQLQKRTEVEGNCQAHSTSHGELQLGDTFTAPRTPIEKRIAQIWGEFLQIDRVGIHDNFFELGGDSILATQVLSRVSESFQIEIPPKVLFMGSFTVTELARIVAQYQLERTDVKQVAAKLKELDNLSNEEVSALLARYESR